MKTFKVKAFFSGRSFGWFDNRRVYSGDFIDVTEDQFSERWMKRVRKEREVQPVAVSSMPKMSKGLL